MASATQTRDRPAGSRPKTTLSRTYMTIEELCADLGISRSTYYDWRTKKKSPPSIKLPNGELRIRRIDYELWLETLAESAA
ncbi:helix-turn-helix transcriptional regulator [Catelliglobosispora koreensis]|uniref:helix-turn-helix transcriptional regulator n=1 Tax=Catelliglobosispora koreensis TaxID=129052 RepID=UPI0012F85806|nr:helix-turn-helix domain-containing protein [Catelliglobosispora koreensis]